MVGRAGQGSDSIGRDHCLNFILCVMQALKKIKHNLISS